MSIAVLHKKDGTGRVGVSISRIASIEEVLGANTATQYTIIQTGGTGAKSYNVSEDFQEVLKAMNLVHQHGHGAVIEPVGEPPAGG